MTPEGLSGLDVKLDGFNDKLATLAARVFGRLAAGPAEAVAFGSVKEALLRQYRNMNMQVGRGLHTRCDRVGGGSVVWLCLRAAWTRR